MDNLQQQLKELVISSLGLEDISADDIDANEALFGDGLGLDSIDALELGVALKQQYQVKIKGENEDEIKRHFYSIATLADYISNHLNEANNG